MKQYQFSLKDECMVEYVPNFFDVTKEEIPVPKIYLSSFTDGKIYNEGEFEIKRLPNGAIYSNGEDILRGSAIPKQKVEDTELWNEVLNALGYGFVNREKFIKEAQEHYIITRKNNQ